MLHGNNVRDVIIAHVMSADAQINIYTNRRGKRKAILVPAGRALRAWPAGNNGFDNTDTQHNTIINWQYSPIHLICPTA